MRSNLALLLAVSASGAIGQSPVRSPSAGTAAAQATVTDLAVRQVILYKNGVGYFEHSGSVTGNRHVAIDFTSSQLNDVLQSLTILDENGGRIGGVNYNSTTPLAEQLKSLSLAMSDDPKRCGPDRDSGKLGNDAPRIADKLKPILEAQPAIRDLKARMHDLDRTSATLTNDEGRARDNLTTLKGNDAAKRFVEELNHAEDELESTRKQTAQLTAEEKAAVESFKNMPATLGIDWSGASR